MPAAVLTSKRTALLAATSAAFLTPFMGSAVNLALPLIGEELAIDALLLSWVSAAYLLGSAIFLVPLGRVADLVGRKKVFLYGLGLFTLSSVFSALVPTALLLIASRLLQGISSAMIFGTGMAILTSIFGPHERGKALGITVAAVYLGLSLGPLLGGILTQHFGWRSVFWATVPLGLLSFVIVLLGLKGEWAEARGESFDWIGSIVYAVALSALMFGFSLLPHSEGLWLVSVGVLGLTGFVFWESSFVHPLLNVRLFRQNRVFAFSNLAALIQYSATFAVIFLLSLYLQYIQGLSPERAGLVLMSQPVMMALLSPLAGKLSDVREPRVIASAGMALTTLALLMLTFLHATSNLWFVISALAILGLGIALFSSPNTNAVMSSVDKKYYGVASGTIGTMRLVGQMLSMGLAMMVLSVYVGREPITASNHPQFLAAMKLAFAISALLCFLGVFASLSRGRLRLTPKSGEPG